MNYVTKSMTFVLLALSLLPTPSAFPFAHSGLSTGFRGQELKEASSQQLVRTLWLSPTTHE